ncbi:MAG: ABC transporter substrate-binding protein, partial [Anaerolineales bacterium]
MKRKSFVYATVFMLMALLLSACGASYNAKATIIIGVTDQISSLDPADAYATHDWELIRNTGRTLLRWNPGTSDLVPDLATAMPTISADGLTYTVKMQSGVQFADGLKLTAQMFAEQLNRLLTIGPSCPNDVADALAIPYVESITASDDVTLVFKLKSPLAYFPQLLATAPYTPSHPDTFPLDKCVLLPDAPVYGVGPWYISQHTQNEQLVLEPNPYYKGDLKPQSAQIIIRYFSDPQTLALAVQNGEIDIAWRFLGPQL